MATYHEISDAHDSRRQYPEPWFSEQVESFRKAIDEARGKQPLRFQMTSGFLSTVMRKCLNRIGAAFYIELIDGQNRLAIVDESIGVVDPMDAVHDELVIEERMRMKIP